MTGPISMRGAAFEHGAGFDAGDLHGGIRLGKFEAQYEELFAEVIEDGIITPEERARLDRAADALGLDKGRLQRLEAALQSAYEAHHHVKILVQRNVCSACGERYGAEVSFCPADGTRLVALTPSAPPAATGSISPVTPFDDDEHPRPSFVPMAPPADAPTAALEKRIAFLEGRVRELEAALEQARNDVAIEVDLGAVVAPVRDDDDPVDLQRRIRQDATDPEPMHSLYRLAVRGGDLERQWSIASALVFLGKATEEQRALYDRHRSQQLPKPTSAVAADAWRRLLFHPDEELLTGDIFGVITPAVLLGRVSALRRDKLLPKLDPKRRQEIATSTISAVRALGWSAAILGLRAPPIYVEPERDVEVEMIPGIPPSVRVGEKLLSGRTPLEIAFQCGRLLACFREEHFVRWLFPGIPDLEDLFLGALTIGNPSLPIPAHAKARVAPIAAAIEPVLEGAQIDRLRGYFLRFVEEGGRTNLQRWAHAVDKTGCRAGLVLCNDLSTAAKVVGAEEPSIDGGPGERVRDLLVFVTSERWLALRKQLGVALVN